MLIWVICLEEDFEGHFNEGLMQHLWFSELSSQYSVHFTDDVVEHRRKKC